MKVLAIVSAILVLCLGVFIYLSSSIGIPIELLSVVLILGFIAFFYFLVYFLFIIPKRKRIKKEEENILIEQERKYKLSEKIKSINEMTFKDLLEQNDLIQYWEVFERNKIEKINDTLKLENADLIDIGISILGDRKKILSLIDSKRALLDRAYNLLKNPGRGEVIRLNKNVYTWIGTFLCGAIGVNRFMRGQIVRGILKTITLGLFGIWVITDLIEALINYNKYEEDFLFDAGNGDWA
jgi:hypothetical protein